MEKITVTVEHDCLDTLLLGFLCYLLTDFGCNLSLGATFETFRRSRSKRSAGKVIDKLHINSLVAAEHAHAGTRCSAGNFAADAALYLISSCCLGYHSSSIFIWR